MRFLLAAMLPFALAGPAFAQQPTPLFASDAPLRLTISGPLKQLMADRQSNDRLPATLSTAEGAPLPVSLKLRGITRRTAEICDFAPLRVDFSGTPPAASPFAGQNKLRLVTHCRNTPSFQQYLLLEYAAYRMANLLSPKSFRVRLAQIDYRDASGRPLMSRSGFFIEDLRDVAARNASRETRAAERIRVADLVPADAARYAMFQHMIANHDWSMRAGPPGDHCCHNAELIGPLAPASVTPIPYDFDFSGLVGAPYATPPDALHISDVRERRYRGYCSHNVDALAAARQMRALRPQIVGVLGQVPGLEATTRVRATRFLDGFFAQIATDDGAAKLLNSCLG
jgi:hypothetical protein